MTKQPTKSSSEVKRILLIILLFAVSAFGQYVAPNEDTVIVCGGLGTMANAAQLNGGGATKAVWDAGGPSDFINTNGGPITTAADCSFTTATKVLASTGIGTGVTVGTLCYVSTGDGAHITAGIYEITAQTNDTITCANIVDDASNDTNVTVNVGGAINTIQNVFDEVANNAALYNRYIYINGIVNDADGTIPVGTAIDIDVNIGSLTTMVIVVGYNVTLTAESKIILQGTADISAIFAINNASDLNWLIQSIDFDAGGANKANICCYGVGATADEVYFEDCIFRNAVDTAAILFNGDYWGLFNSVLKDSGGGFISGGTDGTNSKAFGNSIHDMSGDGIHIEATGAQVINNLVYDCSGDGIQITTGDVIVIGNTCFINDGDNFDLPSNQLYISQIINNVAVGSTAGFGFNMNGFDSPEHLMFGYNLSALNNSGHTDMTGTFANLGLGGNIASVQAAAALFTNVTDGSEDFTPKVGSDLIDNALDAGTD